MKATPVLRAVLRGSLLSVLALGFALFSGSLRGAEAFELSEANFFDERPGGKEADSIIGDYVLRNDKIEAVISGNLPLRRANMSTFYGEDGITPGCLYDLTLKDADNDQIVIFCPLGQRGPINFVRIVKDGKETKEAVIETVTSPEKGGGLGMRHEYRLEDGMQGLIITTTVTNTSDKARKVRTMDVWTKFRDTGEGKGITWADSIDPADKAGYAFAWEPNGGPTGGEAELKPGEARTFTRFLAAGTSPAEAAGVILARRGETGRVTGKITGPDGKGVASARILAPFLDKRVVAYPDQDGAFAFDAPAGKHEIVVEDTGRAAVTQAVEIQAGKDATMEVQLAAPSAFDFTVTDPEGVSIPCKAQFNPVDGTAPPNLGPTDRAHGCVDQYHSANGKFSVSVPPGAYDVVVTRGPEFTHYRQKHTLEAGKRIAIETTLKRIVKTPGWISADFHNHSTPSGDNTCGTDDRIINMAAEQLEFTPTTEHNRLYDWAPHIQSLGLSSFMSTIPGMELTGQGAHFNSFPFTPEPGKQDNGAPVWQKDPRLNAIVLRDYQGQNPDRWVHLNHPDMVENFIDRDGDGKVDGGYAFFGGMIDAMESQNYRSSEILAGGPFQVGPARTGLGKQVSYIREFAWLQMLNQGHRFWGVAVSDAHHVHGNGTGGWRTYVKSSTDDPSKIDWKEITRNAKAGRMVLSSGPYLEVETESGIVAGGLDRVNGVCNLKVRVQCTDWVDIDRIQILVNGRQAPEYNFTREKHPKMFKDTAIKFDETIAVNLSEDAHLIVVARGENHTLKTGFGSSGQSALKPTAYNNPIFVDVDGGGFTPNHDTLGFDLPVKGINVEAAEKALLIRQTP